ncbi:MAG: hypothetical protein D6753_09580 [Planctomycetota bacterium]|nr:MAG: hypothetical protein D6753_09580 [Planctomycetota bacterium]
MLVAVMLPAVVYAQPPALEPASGQQAASTDTATDPGAAGLEPRGTADLLGANGVGNAAESGRGKTASGPGEATGDGQEQIPPPQLDFDAIDGYDHRRIEGWDVLVSKQLLETKLDRTREALSLLAGQLRKIVDRLPPSVVARLRKVPIWVSPTYPNERPRAEYHPNGAWLASHGRRADMAHCIEISNVDIFAKECIRMPMLLLHELAHAYHHQVLGFDYPPILQAFERARQAGLYQQVKRGNGRVERAYALTNHKEYFAECSEAFWGENDFFPFIRSQLERYDPEMAQLLSRVWREDELAAAEVPAASP